MSPATTFGVTLHHLAPDLKAAGTQFSDTECPGVTPDKLRSWLEALAKLAPKTEFPVTPELRIAGVTGRFLVQAKNGQVRVTSWSSNASGSDLTPDRILALIMGTDVEEAASFAVEMSGASSRRPKVLKMVLLAVGILGTNGATAWMLTRPPPPVPVSLLPEHKIVAGEPGRRILADFAGLYETGGAEGDRSLKINADGSLQWIRFGPNRSVAEDALLTAQPGEAKGRPVLVADNYGMIEFKDAITVVYWGESYHRKTP